MFILTIIVLAINVAISIQAPSTGPTISPSFNSTSNSTFWPTYQPTIAPTNSTTAYATKINLGRCSEFALFSGTEIQFNKRQTVVTLGSIGVAPGTSIIGNFVVQDGIAERNTAAAISCGMGNSEFIDLYILTDSFCS